MIQQEREVLIPVGTCFWVEKVTEIGDGGEVELIIQDPRAGTFSPKILTNPCHSEL